MAATSGDGQLPDTFAMFAGTRICPECGDRVAADRYIEEHDQCAGCYWGDRL